MYKVTEQSWWDPVGELYAMGALLNQMRYPYFQRVLTETLVPGSRRLKVLDVGCGGGSLTMLFADAGFDVTGVDPASDAIKNARTRAGETESDASFEIAPSERLPFAAATFDVVICSEVLEHVADWRLSIEEIYRVLTCGGVLLFSTPNRSVWTYLLLIKVAQDWRLTRVMDRVEHRYDKLIGHRELRRELQHRGFDVNEMHGVSIPLRALPRAALQYAKYKLGRAPLADLARSLQLRAHGPKLLAYIGWAIKLG